MHLGLIQVVNADTPRLEWALQANDLIWDALRGQTGGDPAPWLRYRSPEGLAELSALILKKLKQDAEEIVDSVVAEEAGKK